MKKKGSCVICRESFIVKRNTTGKYCSRRCAWLGRGGSDFNANIARQSAEKRGNIQRGRGNGKSYRKLNGKHEHRVVAEKKIGRKLKRHEVVHHKDGNYLNNDPNNLEVMIQAEHMRQHGLAIPGKPLAHKPWEKRWGRQ